MIVQRCNLECGCQTRLHACKWIYHRLGSTGEEYWRESADVDVQKEFEINCEVV